MKISNAFSTVLALAVMAAIALTTTACAVEEDDLATSEEALVVPLWRSRFDTSRCVGTANGGSQVNYTRLVVWDCHGFADQQWQIQPDGRIRNALSGKCIGTENGGSMVNYTALVVWDCHAGADQRWRLLDNGQLQNVYSGKCIGTANGGSMVNYTHLVVWDCHGGGDQRWQFSPNGPTASVSTERHQLGGWVTVTGTASPWGRVSFYVDGLRGRTAPLSLGGANTDGAGNFRATLDARCWNGQWDAATIRVVDSETRLQTIAGTSYAFTCR